MVNMFVKKRIFFNTDCTRSKLQKHVLWKTRIRDLTFNRLNTYLSPKTVLIRVIFG